MLGRVGNQRSLASLYNAISIAMEQWTVEHRMFAYDVYVQNGESHSSAAAFSRSFQPWTPGHRSQPQYDTQVDSQSEDNRKYCKEEDTWSQ